ncbi:TRAP transporter large permease [Natrialba sp. PRR66]|uniref:TRAP transporter large permease n=1 Tax=Natrialba sp. PRR66 TaxID=3098146 RepID=UPI002B1E1860|nr:TRAP transporter large permease [Natrialba sp. PRR66]
MNELLLLAILFLGPLFLLYGLGVPVAIAMLSTSIVVMLVPGVGTGFDPGLINSRLFNGVNSFVLLAIPFYVLLGRLMNATGMTRDIFDVANAAVRQFRGGIAYVNVVASILFSGMSGLALADAAGLGRVEYSAMRDYGYERDISLGVTGSSALIGPIIPPSVPVILYAVLAEESIGQLFLGGILPGILLGLMLLAFVFLIVRKRGYDSGEPFSLRYLVRTLKSSVIALFIPIIIIGGLLGGWFTATEAGAVAVVYVIAYGFLSGQLTVGNLVDEISDATVETFSLTFIIASATVYGLVALQLGLPTLMAEEITALTENPTLILVLFVLMFLIIGTFMSVTASITILTPILIPIVELVGIDPVHFGIVMILALMVGTLTPPFGALLFVLEKVTDASLEQVIRSVVPFYIPILLALVILIFVPELVTYVPHTVMG